MPIWLTYIRWLLQLILGFCFLIRVANSLWHCFVLLKSALHCVMWMPWMAAVMYISFPIWSWLFWVFYGLITIIFFLAWNILLRIGLWFYNNNSVCSFYLCVMTGKHCHKHSGCVISPHDDSTKYYLLYLGQTMILKDSHPY